MHRTNIILYSFIIAFDVVGTCTTIFLFFIMFLRRSIIKTDKVGYLLAANSYIAFAIASPLFMEMFINSIYGQLHSNSSFGGWRCCLKSYALYINGCVYFYSFLLQSIYRFCRIVYPRRVKFQSFRLYAIVSVAQWIVGALMLLPSFFRDDIAYLPEEYHCQISPTNLSGSLLGLSVLFLMPFVATLLCYLYTLHYVRTQTTALVTINRYRNIRRDLIILSRLIFLFTFLTAIGFPHVLIPFIYVFTGYLPFWVVPFEWLLTLFSITAACIIQIFVTPHLKRLCIRRTPVQPIIKLNRTVYQRSRITNNPIENRL